MFLFHFRSTYVPRAQGPGPLPWAAAGKEVGGPRGEEAGAAAQAPGPGNINEANGTERVINGIGAWGPLQQILCVPNYGDL